MTGSQIRTQLSRIIDQLVMDNNPLANDDELVELLENYDARKEAVNSLIEMIEFYENEL